MTNLERMDVERLGIFHRTFDLIYPIIRFAYETVLSHDWFSQVLPELWVGGAPTYPRDYEFIKEHGINSVVNIRAERDDDVEFYREQGINYVRYRVPDIYIPDPETITESVNWVTDQIAKERRVLIHCAKGRGRSAVLAAAYLMREQGMSFEAAEQLMDSKRPLTKLENRHRRVLETWIKTQEIKSA